MVKRTESSPGPQWAAFKEPEPSPPAGVSEDELALDDPPLRFSSERKRKDHVSMLQSPMKRTKYVASAVSGRVGGSDAPNRNDTGRDLASSPSTPPLPGRSIPRPGSNGFQTSSGSSSKISRDAETARRGRPLSPQRNVEARGGDLGATHRPNFSTSGLPTLHQGERDVGNGTLRPSRISLNQAVSLKARRMKPPSPRKVIKPTPQKSLSDEVIDISSDEGGPIAEPAPTSRVLRTSRVGQGKASATEGRPSKPAASNSSQRSTPGLLEVSSDEIVNNGAFKETAPEIKGKLKPLSFKPRQSLPNPPIKASPTEIIVIDDSDTESPAAPVASSSRLSAVKSIPAKGTNLSAANVLEPLRGTPRESANDGELSSASVSRHRAEGPVRTSTQQGQPLASAGQEIRQPSQLAVQVPLTDHHSSHSLALSAEPIIQSSASSGLLAPGSSQISMSQRLNLPKKNPFSHSPDSATDSLQQNIKAIPRPSGDVDMRGLQHALGLPTVKIPPHASPIRIHPVDHAKSPSASSIRLSGSSIGRRVSTSISSFGTSTQTPSAVPGRTLADIIVQAGRCNTKKPPARMRPSISKRDPDGDTMMSHGESATSYNASRDIMSPPPTQTPSDLSRQATPRSDSSKSSTDEMTVRLSQQSILSDFEMVVDALAPVPPVTASQVTSLDTPGVARALQKKVNPAAARVAWDRNRRQTSSTQSISASPAAGSSTVNPVVASPLPKSLSQPPPHTVSPMLPPLHIMLPSGATTPQAMGPQKQEPVVLGHPQDKIGERNSDSAAEDEECAGMLVCNEEQASYKHDMDSDPEADTEKLIRLVSDKNGRLSLEDAGAQRRPLERSSSRSSRTSSLDMQLGNGDVRDTPPHSSPSSRSPTPESDSPHTDLTFGGLKVLTWRAYRANLANFKQKYHLSKDLPHSLQDSINGMSDFSRALPGMRQVFEAAIAENTADDEPEAPLIGVINEVDDDEPTPPWEFYYSNKMWLGEGVPPPDIKNLTSCGCVGKCDPKSKTCACLQRQKSYTGDVSQDFAYDSRGRLKVPGYPIFECNDLCRCDDECRNRVVQHGRSCAVDIKKTEVKGWGVFAGCKKIYKGCFIGVYAGELLTDDVGEERGIKYNKFGRTYLFDLDFHHLKRDNENWELKYVVDAYHAGNFTRFLNHSCEPNCQLNPCYINDANIDKPLLTVFALRDIEPGEEICFSYSGEVDEDGDEDEGSGGIGGKDEAIYVPCLCGAKKCTGVMFK